MDLRPRPVCVSVCVRTAHHWFHYKPLCVVQNLRGYGNLERYKIW